MTKNFKVAGHVFSFTMSETCALWKYLQQYDPFVTDSGEEKLFSMELGSEMPDFKREIIYEAPTEDGETVVKLYSVDGGILFEMSPDKKIPPVAYLFCDKEYKKGTLYLVNRKVNDALFGINNSAMLLFAFRSACKDTLEMHASVILNGGKTYLFLGKSGTGKSTHSSLWLKHIEGSELLNDDNPIVRVWPDGRIIAYGSPWSGKTPCYRNLEAPIGAFVRIRRCKENKITRQSIIEAYSDIYSSSSGFKQDEAMADALHSTMEKVVVGVPSYVLDCRPDEEAARVCAAEVRK